MGGFFFKKKHVLLILLVGFFNYLFDRAFNMALGVVPGLSILYLFQFSLFIPIMDGLLALTLLRFFRHTSTAEGSQPRPPGNPVSSLVRNTKPRRSVFPTRRVQLGP